MRLLTSFLVVCAALAHAAIPTFAILSGDKGGWPLILESVGFREQPAANARIFVLRAGSAGSAEWPARVENGAYLILEGDSSAAELFGFHPSKENVRVASLEDVHAAKLSIAWEKGLELPRYDVPAGARIFAKERWTGAPLMAGFRRGAGAVLWLAAPPGERGYERFPYLLQALADLRLDPPFRSTRLWAFFDSSYRLRVDLDYFAGRWRAAGISALHVAAWHFYDPDPERDAYLKRLIAACHAHGILVYAWLELPHVSDKFWDDHPQWREKTAVLQDAQLDWRKLMNLENRDCFHAVSVGVKDLIEGFDWDGVNLAELYFESLEGLSNPSRFTPMNDDVRAKFRAAAGFDPIEIFSTRKDAVSQRAFLDFRAGLARDMQQEWLGQMENIRRARPYLDLVLTHVDDRLDTSMRDAIGADSAQLLPLLENHNFTFLVEDPATVWNEAPQRYEEIARRYRPLTPRLDRLAIDLNIVDRYQNVYPTRQQTGGELFEVVHSAAGAFAQVALYFENSILKPDLALLPASAARGRHALVRSGAGRWPTLAGCERHAAVPARRRPYGGTRKRSAAVARGLLQWRAGVGASSGRPDGGDGLPKLRPGLRGSEPQARPRRNRRRAKRPGTRRTGHHHAAARPAPGHDSHRVRLFPALFASRGLRLRSHNQAFIHGARGLLRGAFFGMAFRLPDPLAPHARLHRERFGMLRTALPHDHIARRRQAAGLREFLQRALVVPEFLLQLPAFAAVIRGFHRGHATADEFARRMHAAIQVDRRNQRLQRVHQQRLLVPAAAHLLAAAKLQILAQAQPEGHLVQPGGADQVCPQLRQPAFGRVRMFLQQILADQKAQHRVAQEFQLLVVTLRRRAGGGRLLVYVRTVRQGAAEQVPVGEPVTRRGLQGLQIRLHPLLYGLGASGLDASGLAAGAEGCAPPFFCIARTRSACAICLTVGFTSGMAITLSYWAMASSYLPSSA